MSEGLPPYHRKFTNSSKFRSFYAKFHVRFGPMRAYGGAVKRLALLLLVFSTLPAFATNWYIRQGGAGRYDANRVTAGFTGSAIGCDGQADVDYPGSGTNQHCAFNDFRFLWDDQTSAGLNVWAIAGGDVVLIRGCASTPTTTAPDCGIGFQTQNSTPNVWCFGGSGNASCYNPTIPAGTAGAHTKFLGANFASCSAKSSMQRIVGNWGVGTTFNVTGTQYVDFECIELTRQSNCIFFGSPANPPACNRSYPSEDNYADNGIVTDATTANILFQDMWIHGFLGRGIKGPIGGLVTATRIDIDTNGGAGWDFDDGSATPFGAGASLVFNYSIIEWSGCNQEYPFVDPIPVASCYSQSTGGYGDGIGTPNNNTGLNVSMDHSIFRYNTQDGFDFGHVENTGYTFVMTNSISYANGGGQFKWSDGFTSQTATDNVAVANCYRMSQPITGTPSTYNAHLGDFCRAGDAVSINTKTGDSTLFANNTIITYAPTTFDFGCNDPTSCATSVFKLYDNTVIGYDNPATYSGGGQPGGPGGYCLPGCNSTTNPISLLTHQYNDYFGVRTITCPTGSTGEICTSPALTSQPTGQGGSFVESELDVYTAALASNLIPTLGSPVTNAGTAYTGIPANDYNGNTLTSPPPIGAMNPSGSPTTVATPAASPIAGTYTSTQSVTLSTVTAGATICYTTNGTTPAATTPGTCDAGSTTYSGAISVAVTTTIKALGTLVGDTNSGVFSGLYTITPPAAPPVSFSGSVKLSGSVTIP